jgi:hypothetical protein
MSFTIIILTGLFYLIPGIVEMLCRSSESIGNMKASNIYFDIEHKRNFIYITGFSSILFSFTNTYMLRYFFYILFLFSIYSYYSTIKKWYKYLS